MIALRSVLLLSCIIAFSSAAVLLSANEPLPYTIGAGRTQLFVLKGRSAGSGVLQVSWQGTGATLYASAGSIQKNNDIPAQSYLIAEGASDNVDWFFVLEGGSSDSTGFLRVQTIDTVELTSGQLTNFNVPFRGAQLFRLKNASTAFVTFASDNTALELFASLNVVPQTSSGAILNGTRLWLGGSDQHDYYFLLKDTSGNDAATGNITVTADPVTTITAGQTRSVTIPANGHLPFRLPAKASENGVVRSSISENYPVKGVVESAAAGGGATAFSTINNFTWAFSNTQDGNSWFFVITNPTGDSITFDWTVETLTTQPVTSGSPVSTQFNSNSDARLFKLGAAPNKNGAVRVQYSGNTIVQLNPSVIAHSDSPTNDTWSNYAPTDNVDWYIFVQPDGFSNPSVFIVLSAETGLVNTGALNNYNVVADDVRVFKLNNPTKSSVIKIESSEVGVVQLCSLLTNCVDVTSSPAWSVIPVGDNTYQWWFLIRPTANVKTGNFIVTEIGYETVIPGNFVSGALVENEIKLYKLDARENAGGLVDVAYQVEENAVFTIYTHTPNPGSTPSSPFFAKSATTDNVPWYVLLVAPPTAAPEYNFTVGYIQTLIATSKPASFSASDMQQVLVRFDDTDNAELGSSGVINVIYSGGSSGVVATVTAGTTFIPSASTNVPAKSSPSDLVAIGEVQVGNTWWFFVEANNGPVTAASISVTGYATNFFCDASIDCGGRGTCAANGRQCACGDGSGGIFCGCNPAVNCSGHGKCSPDGDSCVCDAFYVGADCSENSSSFIVPSTVALVVLVLSALLF